MSRVVGYIVHSVNKQKFKRIKSDLSKIDALKLCTEICNNTTYAYIEKKYERTGSGASNYGMTIGFYTKGYGEVHKKSNKFIFLLYDNEGFIKSTYDIDTNGRMSNRR